jgi:RNA polymerase sigma-70 factor (ECF subfamily)
MLVWEKQLIKHEKESVNLIYKIAGNILVSKYRRQQVEMKFQNSLNKNPQDISPEDEIQYLELYTKYEKALSELDEKQRVVFLMSRNDNLKYGEIAERLNISDKAVEKRMSKAIAFLKQEMKDFLDNRNN